jgi:drug/metabolite transporter (DMT)-like permease
MLLLRFIVLLLPILNHYSILSMTNAFTTRIMTTTTKHHDFYNPIHKKYSILEYYHNNIQQQRPIPNTMKQRQQQYLVTVLFNSKMNNNNDATPSNSSNTDNTSIAVVILDNADNTIDLGNHDDDDDKETKQTQTTNNDVSNNISNQQQPQLLVQEQLELQQVENQNWITQNILSSYWGPRIVLAICAAIYSTNFALGSIMNDSLPPSAVTASRMTFATITLLPFLLQIKPKFIKRSILTGLCAAIGYVTQSIALTDTDPARVSFLGAATVLWLPILEAVIDKVPMSIKDAPQTWIAAILCLLGVGILELYDPGSSATTDTSAFTQGIRTGDILALIQAIGFGTGAFLSSKLVREDPDQVLSITSVLITTTAVLSWIWCFMEGSTVPLYNLIQSDPIHTNLPLIFAVLWTGIISTSINYVVEIAALGHVPPAEAAVLLASEPVWAAIVAAILIGETLNYYDYIGGACIVMACLVNALIKPQDILQFFSSKNNENER